DTLWSVRLKAPPGFEGTAYPGGMTVLPSGSVVWALRFDRFSPGPPQSFGWLIKVDNDGCVDTLCQLSSIAPEPLATPLRVYPNPAQTSVTFEWPDQSAPAQLKIFDMTGHVVWTQTFYQKTVWEAADTPGGVYLYSIVGEMLPTMAGKILLAK
ncbi:MAG: T9SS type A sorting domain-containing protein, partial [Saprospiraceae bacterium]|nr:T9SS type A sorting domain-containing protein [Saprospiraceae bacterium]